MARTSNIYVRVEPNIAEKLSYRILKAIESLDELPSRHGKKQAYNT